MRQRGAAIAEEFRTKGSHVFLGPSVDIVSLPSFLPDFQVSFLTGGSAQIDACSAIWTSLGGRWTRHVSSGRATPETHNSERCIVDPYLSGEFGFETVSGVQGVGVVSVLLWSNLKGSRGQADRVITTASLRQTLYGV